MKFQKFLIGYNDSNASLQTDLRPWLISDNAFESLQNAYVFRGRVRKRFGAKFLNEGVSASIAHLYSRLRISLGNSVGTVFNGFVPLDGATPIVTPAIGQAFSVTKNLNDVILLSLIVIIAIASRVMHSNPWCRTSVVTDEEHVERTTGNRSNSSIRPRELLSKPLERLINVK